MRSDITTVGSKRPSRSGGFQPPIEINSALASAAAWSKLLVSEPSFPIGPEAVIHKQL
jgi:hypothetical protein